MDRQSFFALYEEYGGMLLAFITNRCRSRHDGAELAQETWLRVWKSLPQFDGTNFRAWLYQIARNILVDHHRRERPLPVGDLPDVPDKACQSLGSDPAGETAAALAGCIEQLSRDHILLVRARLRGEDYAAIGQSLGIPQNTAMTRFHRAKDQLRDCISRKLL